MPSHHPKLAAFEELALHDLDVKFGLDNYDGLKNIGDVMRQPSAMFQVALQESSEISQGDISRVATGAAGEARP